MSHVEDVGRPPWLDSQQSTPLTPTSFFGSEQEHHSDIESCATSVPETVMAEQVTNDVVKEAQSVGRSAPIDDSASTTNTPAVNGEPPSGTATTKATPREASSIQPTVNGADAPAVGGSAHVSDKTEGHAAAVSGNEEASQADSNSTRARVSSRMHHGKILDRPTSMASPANIWRPSRKLWQTQVVAQIPTSAVQAVSTSQSGMAFMCGQTQQRRNSRSSRCL